MAALADGLYEANNLFTETTRKPEVIGMSKIKLKKKKNSSPEHYLGDENAKFSSVEQNAGTGLPVPR